jgi:hypothetical protein
MKHKGNVSKIVFWKIKINPDPAGKPKAYLNWILLDEQFNYVNSYPQSGAIPVSNFTAGTLGTPVVQAYRKVAWRKGVGRGFVGWQSLCLHKPFPAGVCFTNIVRGLPIMA